MGGVSGGGDGEFVEESSLITQGFELHECQKGAASYAEVRG